MDAHELLLLSADPELRDGAARWAAALGVELEVQAGISGARRAWVTASAVLVGDDLAPTAAAASLGRRDHVLVVVGPGAGDDGLWPLAVELGACAVLGRADEEEIVTRLGHALDGRGEACVLGIVGAVGGVGASTLAAVTASVAARRGHEALLLDADPSSAGIDLLVGAEHAAGLRWNGLDATGGRLGADQLSHGLPRHEGVAILTADRRDPQLPHSAVADVVSAAARAFDVVVADVPRRLDGVGGEVLARCDVAVLVVPEDVRGVAAAELLLSRIRPHTPLVVSVGLRRPGGLGTDALAAATGVPVIARLRHDRRLPARVDHALGPARSRTLRRAAGAVLDLLGLDRAGSDRRTPVG